MVLLNKKRILANKLVLFGSGCLKALYLLTLSLFLGEIAVAQYPVEAAEKLIVAIPAKYPPYFLVNNKQPEGFAIDVFDEIAARSGLNYKYEIKQSWAEVCDALKNGSADIVPVMGITEQRKEFMLFTSAIESFPLSIFVRDSNIDIDSVQDLDGRKVAVVNNECGFNIFRNRGKVSWTTFKELDLAFQSLISGQVDAMVYAQTVMENIISDYQLNDKIHVITPPLVEMKRGIAVRQSAPQLRDKLELSLQAFLTSDRYNQIYRKWFVNKEPFWNVEKVFWSMTGLMVFVVVIFLVWRHRELLAINATLQQQIDEATQQLSQSNEYLRDLTVTDTLTGISNRRAFENTLQDLMNRANRYKIDFSMLIFDIDDFKRLNDQYGHDMGDRVLKDLVDRISEIVRDVDVLSR